MEHSGNVSLAPCRALHHICKASRNVEWDARSSVLLLCALGWPLLLLSSLHWAGASHLARSLREGIPDCLGPGYGGCTKFDCHLHKVAYQTKYQLPKGPYDWQYLPGSFHKQPIAAGPFAFRGQNKDCGLGSPSVFFPLAKGHNGHLLKSPANGRYWDGKQLRREHCQRAKREDVCVAWSFLEMS